MAASAAELLLVWLLPFAPVPVVAGAVGMNVPVALARQELATTLAADADDGADIINPTIAVIRRPPKMADRESWGSKLEVNRVMGFS